MLRKSKTSRRTGKLGFIAAATPAAPEIVRSISPAPSMAPTVVQNHGPTPMRAQDPASNVKSRNPRLLDLALGGSIAIVAAIVASILSSGHSWQAWLPLAFSPLLLLISFLFGGRTGILGSALAAIVFSLLLFHPIGGLRVDDEAARANLAWMLLLNISFAFLFAPRRPMFHRQ